MPLYDLFHRPLSLTHEWEALHLQWAGSIAADLNRRLPRRFLAQAPYHLGAYASADVAEVELPPPTPGEPANGAPTDGARRICGVLELCRCAAFARHARLRTDHRREGPASEGGVANIGTLTLVS